MNIKGKFIRLGNITEGTSARGQWRKQDLIIETTTEKFPKQVCLTCWGDTLDAIANLTDGQYIQADISIESREFNGKWYTDVRAFGLSLVSSAPQQADVEQPAPTPAPKMTHQQITALASISKDFFNEQADDLPF